MKVTQKIKDKLREVRRSNPGLTSVWYGYKSSNGVSTGELSIVCGVEKKKPLSELSNDEIIPTEVKVGSQSIKTDIVEMGKPELLTCNDACGQNAGSASIPNRSYTRPVKGGLSISSNNTNTSVGTFGLVVKDIATGAILGLSNNHVTIADAFYTDSRNLSGVIQNDYNPTNNIYQGTEGTVAGGSWAEYFTSANIIGRGVRYVPVHPQSSGLVNNVDAALFSLTENVIDLNESFKQVGLDSIITSNLPFATTSEIDNALASNPELYSSGRTTGPKGGTTCPMRIFTTTGEFPIFYKRQGVDTLIEMEDIIGYFKPPLENPTSQDPGEGFCCNPVRGGDSGSGLIANVGGTIKVIGLVFAGGGSGCDGGPNSYEVGWACRIDEVANQLGITSLDAGDQLTIVDNNSIEFVTQLGGSDQINKECDGATYWQVGLTDTLNNPC